MKLLPIVLSLPIAMLMSLQMRAQATADSKESADTTAVAAAAEPNPPYVRPTERTKLHNYLFDAFGPYPIVGAAIAGGINQADNTPPEWEQGFEGYGRRVGSDFGIAAVTISTRYALARVFREDTLYYRCACKGVLPRFGHAVVATFTARHGDDGHTIFSFPALIAPYVGTMTAVYAWYPDRYNAKDGFRMGNYSLLGYIGGNVALEFLYGGPHSLLSRMHLNNRHGAPAPSRNP